jgi:dephospho-CoA kinase
MTAHTSASDLQNFEAGLAAGSHKPKRLLLGITGTLGAGKGSVVDYLQNKHDAMHFSVRSYLTEVIIERGMPVNRDSMRVVANGLRADNSPSFIVEQLYAQAKERTATNGKCAIIESVRTPGEVDALKKVGGKNFFLVAVDADPALRYSRVTGRGSATDSVSFDKFISDEQAEMNNTDPNMQNLSVCMDRADFTIHNDDSFEKLELEIEKMLWEMHKQQNSAAL